MSAATAVASTAAMTTAKAAAMAAAEASFMPAAKTACVSKAAVAAERIVMSGAVMVFPIMVVSEIRFIVASTKISIRVRRVAIARRAIVVVARFAASTYYENE
jgi:hypothetical protein